MNNKLRPYEQYKETGLDWLGRIPEHWSFMKIGMIFKERRKKVSDKDFIPLSVTKNGVVLQLSNAAKSNDGDNRKLVKQGDFVINSRSDRKGSSGLSKYNGSVSLINIVLEPHEINHKYAHYLFKSQSFVEEFYKNGRGIVADLWTTRFYEMRNIHIPIPIYSEQDQIVKYLDYQLAKINKFIKAKKKLIAVLQEQKQAIINQAVTKGLDPNVKMKPSGIEWLGDIPEHWEISRCKYLFREMDLRSENGIETHLSMIQKYGLVSDDRLEERRLLSESYVGGKICVKNDLVLNRLKAHLGVFALAPQTGVISPDYTVLRPNKKILPMYAEAVLKSSKCRKELRVRVRGIVEGFWRLYTDDFNTIVLPLPDYDEQVRIMEFIEVASTKIDNAMERIEGEIELTSELKNSLISDVVTGKVDIRHIDIAESDEINNDEFEIDEELADEEVLDAEDGDE